jgi:biopolymer transport protein TolQ
MTSIQEKVIAAVEKVEATTLAGSQGHIDFSMYGMFMQADIVVKGVIILLIFMSFWSWAIMFEKWFKFKSVNYKIRRFEQDFWSSEALDKFFEKIKRRANHTVAHVFVAGMEEWFRSRTAAKGNIHPDRVKRRVERVMQVATNRELEKLEGGMNFLATVGSTAPFIGLFGTVWGIMNSFQAIAVAKNTSLNVVAPGIAEALFATAIGLFAAIPAVMAFNKFSATLARVESRLDDFTSEFLALLSRQMDTGDND